MLKNALTVLSLLAFTWVAAQGPVVHSRVAITLNDGPSDMRALAALGLPIDHADLRDRACIVELDETDIARVRAQGFSVDVLIPDMSAWYRARNAEPPPDDRALGWLCDGPTDFTVPQHFNTGSMGGFFTWEEMLAELDEMVALYPDLISEKEAIGSSLENRPIHYVRISNAPNQDQDKPEVLYTAVHHAREPASMSQLIFYMWWLLENHGTDAEATYLVDNREMYFVPCINPDGYVYNQVNDPDGGGMWRKNRRNNGDGTFGVDLNRNYGWLWGFDDMGSSPDGNSETYRGAAPFSEPETQVMRDFCNAHAFRAALNYHSAGDMVIHPWASQADLLTPDSALYTAHADRITRNNGYSRGTCQQVLYYLSNGSSDDWMYGEQTEKPRIIAMTPETGQADEGFWPPSWRIVPLCKENMDQNLVQAHLVGAYAAAYDRSSPILGQLTVSIPFEVRRLGMDTATFTVSIEPLENIASVGTPLTFANMELLESRLDSISVDLSPTVVDGDRVRFILAVGNGLYTHRDTVERYFGVQTVAFSDAADDLDAWTAQDWGLSTQHWHSPPSSITDSPTGNYVPYSENTLTLADPIDLSAATSATLRFWARWDISQIRDLLEVSASEDGFLWTPLCGIHTRPGSYFQGNDVPVFEGRKLDWVREELSLDQFIGGEVRLRFRLLSQMDFTRDGFYLDDLEILTTTETISGLGDPAGSYGAAICSPIPTADRLNIRTTPGAGPQRLCVHDAVGALVLAGSFTGASTALDVRHLPEGSYSCVITSEAASPRVARFVIAR